MKGFLGRKNKLVNLLQRFGHTNPDDVAKRPHPFFGKLTAD